MKNSICVLAVAFLFKDVVCVGDLLSKFHQHTYKVKDIRVQLFSYDKNFANVFEFKSFKYNRTTTAVNCTMNLKVNCEDKLEVLVQEYKFLSNEYRKVEIRFQVNLKKCFDTNVVGLQGVTKHGNITNFVFYKDITYHMYNFVFDETHLPPLVPNGGIALSALYYFWMFNYWKKKGVKTLRPHLLFGNLTGVIFGKVHISRILQEVYETCKKHGDECMGFYFFNVPALVIADLKLAKRIFTKDFDHFADRPFYHDVKDSLTIHLASAKGSQWKKMRDQLTPAFSPSKMKYMCHTLLQVGDQLKSVLDESVENCKVVNMKDLAGKFMVDAIGMGIFGIECNTLKNFNIEFRDYAENTFGGSFNQNIRMTLTLMCPSVLHFFKIPFNNSVIQNFYLNLVKSTVEYREKNNVVRNDLMHSIIQLRNNIDIQQENNLNLGNVLEIEKSLMVEEITAQALVFFGAAYETSLSTILLCLYELASNENIKNNLREEIVSVLSKCGGKPNYEAVMEMTYLDKCVTETLRKYGLTAITARYCTKSYKLPNNTDTVLDIGTIVYIPIYEIHHDPEYYPNPEKFDPERFSHENKAMRPSSTFLTFGEGQRNCIGSRLALLQVKIFLVTILSNYNFNINSRFKLPPTLSNSNLIASLKNPLYLNIEKL